MAHRSIAVVSICCMLLVSGGMSGCAAQPTNPSFPLTVADARKAVDKMRLTPVQLQRPLVIIGGIGDPNFTPPIYRRWFERLTRDTKIITVSIGTCGSFESCRQAVVDAVDKACPSTDPLWTTEVDVMGASLGGLVARFAAGPAVDTQHPRRLRIQRLFSISSPHTGAALADRIALTQMHRDLRTGSAFMRRLANLDHQASYEVYPYVRLSDQIVGEEHAAPPGLVPIWVPNHRWTSSHDSALFDDRILADIARRLRGEAPFSHPPFAPLPEIP